MDVVCSLRPAHFTSGNISKFPTMSGHLRAALSREFSASHRSWCASTMCLRTRSKPEALQRFLDKEKAMVTIRVKGGIPPGCESLCRTCTRGHIITGFRATEEEVFCRTFYIEREIRFPVRECTFYEDRRLASKEDMEEIAWKLRSTTTKPNQSLGFVSAAQLQEIESEAAEIASTNADELTPSG